LGHLSSNFPTNKTWFPNKEPCRVESYFAPMIQSGHETNTRLKTITQACSKGIQLEMMVTTQTPW